MKQNLRCCSLTIKEPSRPTGILPSLVNVNLTKQQSLPGQRITALRVAVRKTIEFLNEPYVRHMLEQRGINVDEKLMELRSRFTVLAKYPVYTEDDSEIPMEKYEYPPLEFIEPEKKLLSPLNFYLELVPVSNEVIDEKA